MVSTIELKERPVKAEQSIAIKQTVDFLGGNEAAAVAASDIGFHVMGYFPITPSTEVAETLAKMEAGKYGLCEVCGEAIPMERLKALPHSTKCVPCASRTR